MKTNNITSPIPRDPSSVVPAIIMAKLVRFTALEVYTNVVAEIRYKRLMPRAEGGINASKCFYFLPNPRQSSEKYAAETI